MAEASSTVVDSSEHIEWMWKANPNPWSKTEPAEWKHYSDVENLIIEEAFSNGAPKAVFDQYYIDLKHNVQILTTDKKKQRPVKRVKCKREDKHLREERFMENPIASQRAMGGQYGWVSPFIIEVRRSLGLEVDQLPSKNEELVPMLVEKAADGIIEEGKQLKRLKEAEKMAKLLREKKNEGFNEVWKRCVHLYSMESFLYKKLNETMRLIGTEEHEQTWRNKVHTLGPFCLLLWDDPINKKFKSDMTLYRGAKLEPEQIAMYEDLAKRPHEYHSWQAFTSCSRNRTKAEGFGNALFVIQVTLAFVADISSLSQYQAEEEELIAPGVCFRVLKVVSDPEAKKHVITLELRQRWSEFQTLNVSSTREIPSTSFYSSRKRLDHELIVTNGKMAKKTKPIPEVICLSDDEDDDQNISKSLVTPVRQRATAVVNGDKKPEISNWTVQRKDIIRVPDLTIKSTDLIKKPLELPCSTVRFGMVEFNLETDTVFLRETDFELKLKSAFMSNLNIKLAYSDILSFYYSFQSIQAIAFIQVRPEFAELFAKYIPSIDEQGKQFDPNSKDAKRCRIILYLETLKPDVEKLQVSSIYYYLKTKAPAMNISYLSGSRAQELYDLSRNARASDSAPTTTSPSSSFVIDETDLTPKTVGVNHNTIRFHLSREDLLCLNEGEFLNDNIIDLYLQYVYYEKLSEEDRKRTYLFNSFFYTRLTRKGTDDIPDISAAERRYSRVKRWLRDVDIFSKDYLIVPINQTAHWYIVIIQYHDHVLTEGDLISDDEDVPDNRVISKKKKTTNRSPEKNSNQCSEIRSNTQPIEIVDEADEVLVDDNDSEKSLPQKTHSQKPTILMFDSLRAGSKNRVAATLREFLQLEYDHKKTLPVGSLGRKIFNLDTIPALEAAVPQQPNYFDCGLYILQYLESFFAHRSPSSDFQSPTTFANWCEKTSIGSSKRKEIFSVINEHVIPKEE